MRWSGDGWGSNNCPRFGGDAGSAMATARVRQWRRRVFGGDAGECSAVATARVGSGNGEGREAWKRGEVATVPRNQGARIAQPTL
ncbi:MAG: hypothetical protein GX862_10960 [Leucobacter sp.]|nr:hypothetical protein [Leucobacter sp.]